MSEENNEKPSADKPAEEEAPKIEPGKYGKMLDEKGLAVTHLGPNASGVEVIEVAGEQLCSVGEFLRDEAQFDLLLDISGVDMKEYRLSVTHLYSTQAHEYVTLKTRAADEDTVPSLTGVWPAADWHERETYDLMGIIYEGHPKLERILMPNDWLGYPLRKDYVENDPRLIWNRR